MTILEVQEALGEAFVLTHAGASKGRAKFIAPWSVTIEPAPGNRRWPPGEVRIRGSGLTLEAALEAGLDSLAVFLAARVDRP